MHSPTARLRPPLDAEAIARLRVACEHTFAAHPAVAAAYLYGSAARAEPAADVDIAVLLDGDASTLSLEAMAARLQREGAPHGPDIDLRSLRGTSPRFRANVIRGLLLFERSPTARIAFETQAMLEWLDFKPTWEGMRARMIDRWIHG
jgi:predicted nucleotidyltransferase